MGWLSEWIEGFSNPSQEERERKQKEKELRERFREERQGNSSNNNADNRSLCNEKREEDERQSMKIMIAIPQNMLEKFNIDTSEFMDKQPVPVKVNNLLCYGFSEQEFSTFCDFYSFRKSDYSLTHTGYEGVLFVRFKNI